MHIASTRLPLQDIVEARILLETGAARVAAQRDDPAGLQKARELVRGDGRAGHGSWNP